VSDIEMHYLEKRLIEECFAMAVPHFVMPSDPSMGT
jgi:hypothetical protein